MKRTAAVLFLATALVSGLAAQSNPLIIYSSGEALVQDARGKRRPAAIGTFVYVDETLITGRGGVIQLQSRDGVFDMRENTAFKLMQAQTKGKRQNAYLVALGRVTMKVNKVATGGTPPRLGSTTAAAGVKGTTLDVYEGADGSSLILVTEGQVEVESQGTTVTLAANEGVEVTPGRAPGGKFTFKKPEDYRGWIQSKLDEFEKDPVASVSKVEDLTNEYIAKIEGLWKDYLNKWVEYETEWAKWKKIAEEQGEEASVGYFDENVLPLGNAAADIFKEIRYNSLSLLSLRRYVVGRMYLLIRTKFIGNEKEKVYINFMNIFDQLIKPYNDQITVKRNYGAL